MTTPLTALRLRCSVGILLLLASMAAQVASAQKRALVVSGGGAKGAYAAGVLSVLMRDRGVPGESVVDRQIPCVPPEYGSLKFDVFVGTSTGALITPLAHQNRIREMTRFYTAFGTADVLMQRPLLEALSSAESFYTVGPLRRLLLEEYAADGLWEAIRADPEKLLVVTGVDLQRGDLVLFYTGEPSNREVAEVGYRWEPIATEAEFLEAILASSSEPVGLPPVRWKNSYIWDGGVRSAMPISVALAQQGVEEVWVIGLNPSPDSPMRAPTKPPATGFEVLKRTIDVFGNNVAANDLTKMDLLVKGWRERARVSELQKIGRSLIQAANGLPDTVRKTLQAQIGPQLEQLSNASRVKDSVLGAAQGDRRERVQVFVIRPFESLPGTSLENTLQDQRLMYRYGQNEARGYIRWLNRECRRLLLELRDDRPDTLAVLFRVFAQSEH